MISENLWNPQRRKKGAVSLLVSALICPSPLSSAHNTNLTKA